MKIFCEGEKLLKLYIISYVLIGDFSAQKGIIRVWGPVECCSRRLRRSSRMSAREGSEGEAGNGMEDKEAREEGGEIILRRDGDGSRKNMTSLAFFILHNFHSNSVVELIISIKFFTFLMSQPKACFVIQPTSRNETEFKKTDFKTATCCLSGQVRISNLKAR